MKTKTVYDLFNEKKDFSQRAGDASNELAKIIVKKTKAIAAFKRRFDETNAPKVDVQKKIKNKWKTKSLKVEEKINKIEMPWDETIEKIINILNQNEGGKYELVCSEDVEWFELEHNEQGTYKKMYVVYIKEQNAKFFNRLEEKITEDMQPFGIEEGTLSKLKETDGVIVLYTQGSKFPTYSTYPNDKFPLNLPYSFRFGKSDGYKIVGLEDVLTGKYEYLIQEIAKTINIK